MSLCEGVSTFMPHGELSELRDLILHGPQRACATEGEVSHQVKEFYQSTRSLMLRRARINESEVVSTLTQDEADRQRVVDRRADPERRERILRLVLSHGMSGKKKHEVSVMEQSTMDLVHFCASKTKIPVTTIMNVGEGKGYVSRALSLCDGMQLIGLDCNPQHKDGAMSRMDSLIELSLASSMVKEATKQQRNLVNLLYERKGPISCIACRVGPGMDWEKLLTPSLPTERDGTTSREATGEEPNCCTEEDKGASPVFLPTRVKGQCRVCGCVVRFHGTCFFALQHIQRHLSPTFSDGDVPLKHVSVSPNTVRQWGLELSLVEYHKKKISTFFEILENEHDSKSPFGEHITEPGWRQRYALEHISRGVRVRVACAPDDGDDLHERVCTVLGYCESTMLHHVFHDVDAGDASPRERRYHMIRETVEGDTPSAGDLRQYKAAIVVEVLAFSETPVVPVRVPSLSNVVMIGLHTCGDLGATICRLFTESRAPGLLLVSCCWNTVTEAGFPLSRAIRGRGLTAKNISLMLATQPLDMWTTESSEGHRSSAKVCFCRSLLHHFWARAAQKSAAVDRPCGCMFMNAPHLEPAFLRRVSQQKDILTFRKLCGEAIQSYAKVSPYNRVNICDKCEAAQRETLWQLVEEGVAEEMEEAYTKQYFLPFLGLTVLRMWMCHLVESVLLLDRTLYIHEQLSAAAGSSSVSLVPLFDGSVSPRMYAILASRYP
ncbi:hypothetical protein AGDE_07306 [Angomonas deanei]|uniref:Methyltransferase domain containing protein, putative n=1 Tax=Angomonas deanei TaxID=59799 RepID=A0A7G2CP93_9TRYP|nr:hypothetical protein AGDE_07306 [Angomonas deanei]CAD2221610.1 Methyltransferase domain containing protein, putative [Angomonas deanei]|eukprot:EPY35478.1 hypothetical protein AGDE_07306 [Angomonas deanei]